MRKKSNGEGSITYEEDRKAYRARLYDPNGKRISKRFKKKSDAVAWLQEVRTNITKNTYIAPSTLSVGDWLIEFLEVYKYPNVRPKTLADYAHSAKFIVEGIGSRQLQRLTASDVQKFYNTLTMAQRTKIQIHRLLKAAIEKAVALDVLPKNIMLGVDAPQAEHSEIEIFTQEECKEILSYIKSDETYCKYYPFFLTAFATGCRIGELTGLKVACVTQDYLYIKSTRVAINGKEIESAPKTKAGVRKIRLDNNTFSVLSDIIDGRNGKDYVFQTRVGTPFTQAHIRKVWQAVLTGAHVPFKKFHTLRHTHASLLLASGVPIPEVSKRLGHSKIAHTLNMYSHAIPNQDKEVADKVGSIFKI